LNYSLNAGDAAMFGLGSVAKLGITSQRLRPEADGGLG
jgi:hypothetical protein